MHPSKPPSACTPRMRRTKRALLLGSLSALALAGATRVAAQDYPQRPVKMLVGTPAGGLADVLARHVGQQLGVRLGQPFIVDNKAGASGLIAIDAMVKSAPDGHTLVTATDTMMVVNQFVYPKLPYDPDKDTRAVALLGKATLVLVAHPSLGVKSAEDFFALAKSKPNEITYSSGGPGHPLHLAIELIQSKLGFKLMHVPYRGAAPAAQAVLGGEVKAMIIGVAESMQHIRAGKLIPLAATGPAAQKLFPSLPELKRFHPDLDLAPWFGLFGPSAMATSRVNVVNQAASQYLQSPEAAARLADFGITPMTLSPSDLDALVIAEKAKYGPLIQSLGIKAE